MRFQKIDSHAHIFPTERHKSLLRWMNKAFPSHPYDENYSAEDIAKDIFDNGAEIMFALPFSLKKGEADSLNFFHSELRQNNERIIPFAAVHKDDENPANVVKKAIEEYNLCGLKFHPMVQRFSPAAKSLLPAFDYLNKMKMPVFIHTGYDAWYNYSLSQGDIEFLVKSYPHMAFVFVHCFFPDFEFAQRLMEKYNNVWLDATNVFGTFVMLYGKNADTLMSKKDVDFFMKLLSKYENRIMFGTDHPVGMGSLQGIYSDLDLFGIPDNILHKLCYSNARDFLKKILHIEI